MAATLLIIGLTLFLLGSLALAREASTRGHTWILLLIPFASARYVQNNWSDVWLPALLRVLGFAMVLAAIGVVIARDPLVLENPDRLFGVQTRAEVAGSKRADLNSFVNSAEAIQLAIQNDENETLSGRIHGHPFIYDRVEIIDGLLAARQGSGFLPELELRILLNKDFSALERRETIYVHPGDTSPPVVHLSWKDEDGKLQTELVRSGYRMELQLAPLTRHQLSGFLQIILPDAHQSFLSGEFVAYTNRLRYQGDRVDLTYDHVDTLKYVAEQYLHTQFPEGAVQRIIFSDTDMRLSRDEGSTTATVELASGRIERRMIPLERSDIGWSVRPSGMEVSVVREAQENGSRQRPPVSSEEPGGEAQKPAEKPVERQVEFSGLAEFVGMGVETVRTDDKRQQGVLREAGEKRIVVEASVGGGTVRYQVKRGELVTMRVPARNLVLLLESDTAESGAPMPVGDDTTAMPDSKDVQDTASDTSAPASESEPAESTPVDSTAGETADETGLSVRLSELVGQRVSITDTSGRTRTGLLKSTTETRATLTVQMGSGSVDYYYKAAEIRSVEPSSEAE